MTNARPSRRRAGSLWCSIAVVLLATLAGSGCQRMPLRLADLVQPAETKVASTQGVRQATGDQPALAVPPLAERPLQLPVQADDSHAAAAHAPTPMLDAAIAKAEDRGVPPPSAEPEPLNEPPPELEAVSPEVPRTAKPEPPPKVDPHVTTASVPPEPQPRSEPEPDRGKPPVDVLPMPPDTSGTTARPINAERPVSRTHEPPADPWAAALERLQTLARARAQESGGDASPWGLRVRLIDTLHGDPVDAAQLPLWNSLINVLTAATTSDTPDEAAVAANLHEAVAMLEALAPLQVGDVQVCRKVVGFGHYEPLDAKTLRPGQPFIVYCEMSGVKYGALEGMYRSRLASRAELYARGTSRPAWSQDLGTAEDLCRHRRRDYYVNYRLALPPDLPAGNYELRLTQTDLLGDRSVQAALPLEIRP